MWSVWSFYNKWIFFFIFHLAYFLKSKAKRQYFCMYQPLEMNCKRNFLLLHVLANKTTPPKGSQFLHEFVTNVRDVKSKLLLIFPSIKGLIRPAKTLPKELINFACLLLKMQS